ncbi:MAG: DNA-3-methyladenine glycosylase 2 [Candidatus Micrarchaeia archaeon]
MRYYQLFAERFPTRIFNLKHTVESAQPLTFYAQYNRESNSLTYPTYNSIINVAFKGTEKEGELIAVSSTQNFKNEIQRKFRLDDKMTNIYKHISTDKYMKEAIKEYYGMRLTYNDPWEATLCFVVSQNNNVPRIRNIILKLIDTFGHPIKDENDVAIAKSFPSSGEILGASIETLKACGTGFRARYIKAAADFFTNNLSAKELSSKKYPEIKEILMEIDGIGDKVADCIALMGCGKLEAFPIDTWSKKTLERFYFHGKPQKIDKLHDFAYDKWGKYAGYAQQYLFWYGRQSKL